MTNTKTKRKKSAPPLTDFDYQYRDDVLIPADFQLGLKWIGDNGEKYTSVCFDYLHGKRKATLIESTYVGTAAIGALHYYGRIEAGRVCGKIEGEDGAHGGYMGKTAPKLVHLSLQVQRRISKIEKDLSGERLGKIGDWTYRFNLEKDVLPEAIKLFKRKFGPGWILVDQYDEKVLCET